MLKVTNNNDFSLNDRYDGKAYAFPPHKSVIVGEEAARHIFGLGEDDKMATLVRIGWIHTAKDYDIAMERLNNFSFDVVDMLAEGTVVESGPGPLLPEPVENGHESALMLNGAAAEAAPDGAGEAAAPDIRQAVPMALGRGSILDKLQAGA